jgi:GNAT superfamily N-acetyltransferase
MSDILQDLTEQSFIRAIEENMYGVTPFTHNWPGMEKYTSKDVSWCMTNNPFPVCNAIIRVNMKPQKIDPFLEKMIARAKERKVNLICYITEKTRPANLAEYLMAYGFTSQGGSVGMAIDLADLNEANRAPKGLEIIEVEDEATLKTWCQVAGSSFGVPEVAIPSIVDYFILEMKLKQPVKLYLGLLDGKPVATSNYYLGEGVCGLYFVGTLPEARNKGIGFAITQKPLLEAKKLGYRAGILQASKMGRPVYLRLGFEEYCRIGSYSWIYELNKEKEDGKAVR